MYTVIQFIIYNILLLNCSNSKTRPVRRAGIIENVGEVAIELEWINAPAKGSKGIEIVGKTQLLTVDNVQDYEARKIA